MDKTADLAEHESNEADWFKCLAILTAIWAPFYIAYWSSWNWLFEGIGGLASLVGIPGALFWLISAAFYKSKRMFVCGAIVAACSVLVLSNVGETIKAYVTLAIHRKHFSSTVAEALKSPERWQAAERLDNVTLDTNGGGVRVAFDLGAGFIDDHKSIVYDAEGRIAQPRTPGKNDHLPFEGYYSTVMHLDGPWYFVNLYPDVPVDGR